MEAEISQEEVVRDVTSVSSRLQLHQELKAEIDAREDTFRTVAENGQLMIDAGHFAASDVCTHSNISYYFTRLLMAAVYIHCYLVLPHLAVHFCCISLFIMLSLPHVGSGKRRIGPLQIQCNIIENLLTDHRCGR